MSIPSDGSRTTSAAALTSTASPSTAPDLPPIQPALKRTRWTCGEADWLTQVAKVPNLRATVGYPRHFGVRDVVALMGAQISPSQAMACGADTSIEEVIAACRS